VPLLDLLQQTVELLVRDPQWRAVDVTLPSTGPLLHVDPDQVRTAFLNVLINAAQAMDGHGRLSVEAREGPAGCEVRFTDTGPGIPPESRDRVLEPFFTTRHRGTGLGLAIVRRVAQAHGGNASIDCPAGGGTVVSVTLPLAEAGGGP
jgi:two-component system sensor histidine kinase HydH